MAMTAKVRTTWIQETVAGESGVLRDL